jgi:hypothetical protein
MEFQRSSPFTTAKRSCAGPAFFPKPPSTDCSTLHLPESNPFHRVRHRAVVCSGWQPVYFYCMPVSYCFRQPGHSCWRVWGQWLSSPRSMTAVPSTGWFPRELKICSVEGRHTKTAPTRTIQPDPSIFFRPIDNDLLPPTKIFLSRHGGYRAFRGADYRLLDVQAEHFPHRVHTRQAGLEFAIYC